MKNILRYSNFIKESENIGVINFLDDIIAKYKGSKQEILKLVKSNLKRLNKEESIDNIKNLFGDLITNGLAKGTIIELVDSKEFYQKYKVEIDNTLKSIGWFDQSPSNNKIYSVDEFYKASFNKWFLVIINELNSEIFQ
jgi:hypothetical protein